MERKSLREFKEKVLAIIPARGGSKGVPRKNIRLLAGKPLIAHTIEQALSARIVGRTIVSTDDEEIAEVAKYYGAEVVKRPADLAIDTSSSESALLHVLDHLHEGNVDEPEIVVFLQCTSPFREENDIDNAVEMFDKKKADSLVSVTPWHGFIWQEERGWGRSVNFDYRHRPRRQDLPQEFRENGSIFIFKPWVLQTCQNRLGGKIVLFPMDYWSTFEVDTEADFALCEWILKSRQGDST